MEKEELFKKYEEVNKLHADLESKIFDMLLSTYSQSIENSNSEEELEKIWIEIATEWPDGVGRYLMYLQIKKRKEKIK